MRSIALIAGAACALGLGACGAGAKHPSVPVDATTVRPPSLDGLPPAAQAQVKRADATISAYCARAARTAASTTPAAAPAADDQALRAAVSSLIALGREHRAKMDNVLFAAERVLGSGCYPSQAARVDRARAAGGP